MAPNTHPLYASPHPSFSPHQPCWLLSTSGHPPSPLQSTVTSYLLEEPLQLPKPTPIAGFTELQLPLPSASPRTVTNPACVGCGLPPSFPKVGVLSNWPDIPRGPSTVLGSESVANECMPISYQWGSVAWSCQPHHPIFRKSPAKPLGEWNQKRCLIRSCTAGQRQFQAWR